ncbi:hypothetical protein Dimus_027112 [Dionaea muscipula]
MYFGLRRCHPSAKESLFIWRVRTGRSPLVLAHRHWKDWTSPWIGHSRGELFKHLCGQMAQIWRCHSLLMMNLAAAESGSDSDGEEANVGAENAPGTSPPTMD